MPKVHEFLPYVIYPVATVGLVWYMIKTNYKLLAELDSKYTPIWIRISHKSLDDEDDDED